MVYSTGLLLFYFLSLASAAPWPADTPLCSKDCPITGSPKLSYVSEKTYLYSYSGKSQVRLQDVEGGVTETSWNTEVRLTWLSPCDVAITIKNPHVDGAAGPPAASSIDRYPLVVAVTDGHVQYVCSHADDDTWSLNIKKGIASALQNSLPTLSSVNSGLNFTEIDVVGSCPTEYEVKANEQKIIVTKEKHHRQCQNHYQTQSETPITWLQTSLPVEESWSSCKQEIMKNIYTTVTCKNKNIIRPSYGSYKYIEAYQEATLVLQSEDVDPPPSIATLQGQLVQKSLLYEHQTAKKDPSVLTHLHEVMGQLCNKSSKAVDHDAADLVSKAIHYMKQVPDQTIEETLNKIRRGQFCRDFGPLESLFLDAVASIHESGAVKVMVDELINNEISESRNALYIAAMYLTPRPNLNAVEALKSIFMSSTSFPQTSLAAASMVNTYCRINPDCESKSPVLQILKNLGDRIERDCAYTSDDNAQQAALVNLKVLGNLGVINTHYARALIRCIERVEADMSVRVAAVQAFRNAECQREATTQLSSIAVDPNINSEVRIASYLEAIRCAEVDDLMMMIERITKETSTQVRGFILSHLLNIQKSKSHEKANLREMLTDIILPTNFTVDSRKYSSNIDLSYYSPFLDTRASMESNIVYTTASYIPRSVKFNLTTAIGGTPMNLGEFGAGVKGLEPILEDLFGPDGYFRETSYGKMLDDVNVFSQQTRQKIVEEIKSTFRQRRSIGISTILIFLEKLYGGAKAKVPQLDVFARFMGQEIIYSSVKGNMNDINIDKLIEAFFNLIRESIDGMKNMHLDKARGAQIRFDYSLPTIQGVPLKLELEGTAVIGLKMNGKIDLLRMLTDTRNDNEASLNISPSFSTKLVAFVGYDSYIARKGLKLKNTFYNAEGVSFVVKTTSKGELEIGLDFPQKTDLINIESEIYLVKALKGRPEEKLMPSSIRDIRIQHHSCNNYLEAILGLKLCYDINIPNIFLSEGLPLGQKSGVKFFIEKNDLSMTGYHMTANIQNNDDHKSAKILVKGFGTSITKEAEATLSYRKEANSHKISAAIESTELSSGVWMSTAHQEQETEVEVLTKYKTAQADLTRKIKIAIKKNDSIPVKENEVKIYVSPNSEITSDSLVAEWKFIQRCSGLHMNFDLVAKTSHILKHYIDLNFESRMDLIFLPYLPIPLKITAHKFEFHISLRGWKMTSFIRKMSDSTYKSAFALTRHDNELLSLVATHIILVKVDGAYTLKTALTAKTSGGTYKTSIDIINENMKAGIAVQVIQPTAKLKVFELEVTFWRVAVTSFAKILVDIPHHMNPIQFDNTFVVQRNQILIQSVLKHGKHLLLEMNGPVSFTASLLLLAFEADLQVTTLTTGPYGVNVAVQFSQITQLISLDVKDQKTKVISLKWNVDTEKEEETVYGVELHVPTVIDNEFYLVVSEGHIGVFVNNLLFPQTPSPRRVKGLADLNVTNKTLRADLSWDADRFPNKKLSLDLSMISSPFNPELATINGGISFVGKTYLIRLTTVADGDTNSLTIERGVDLTIMIPSKKTMDLLVNLKLEQQTSSIKLQTSFMLKTLEKKQYKSICMLSIENLHAPYSYRVVTKATYTPPSGHESKLNTEAQHMITSAERLIHFKIIASNHAVQIPLMMEIQIRNRPYSSGMNFQTKTNKSTSIMSWDLQSHPDGGVRNVNINIELALALDFLRTLRRMTDGGLDLEAGILAELFRTRDTLSYNYKYFRPSPSSHAVVLRFPSRTMEGEINLSASEYNLKFYPDRERSETKYEIAASYRRSLDQTHSEWQGRISHPSLTRDIQVAIQYQNQADKIKGTLEVDIFPDTADKVTGTIESTQISENSHQIEATIITRVLGDNPRLTMTTSYAPHTIGLDIHFKPTPAAEPSFVMACKYEQFSGQSGAVSFHLISEGQTKADITGAIGPVERPDCDGLKITLFTHVPVIGKHDIKTEVCKAAFIQVVAKAHGDGTNIYRAAFGLQEPNNFEISFYEDKATSEPHPIILLKSELVTPTLVTLDTTYRSQEVSRVVNLMGAEVQKIRLAVNWWFLKIHAYLDRQAKQHRIVFPSPKMVVLFRHISQEIEQISRDLVQDGIILRSESLIHFLQSPRVTLIKDRIKWAWSHVTWFQKKLENHLVQEVTAWQNEFKEIVDCVIKDMKEAKDLIENGAVPEEIKELLANLEQSFVLQTIKRKSASLATSYPEELNGFQQTIVKTKATLDRDVTQLWKRLLQMPSTQRFIKWIMNNTGRWTELEARHLVSEVIQRLTFFSIEAESNGIKVNVPLSKPVYSLSQVTQRVFPSDLLRNIVMSYYVYIPTPLNELLWSYYNFLPNQIVDLVPPFNRTAMIVGDTDILTFDGVLLRLPRSQCQVLLASYMLNELTMDFPEEEGPPQFTLTVSGTIVIVKSDRSVTINGRLVTKHHRNEGQISILTTHLKVKVTAPFLTLHVARTSRTASLRISGWAFGRVAGFLGTYDGEVGNDWMMPSGAMATNMQQLVSSWQENQQCETPSIVSVDPPFAKVVRCNAMLNIRSRCSAVVEPDLFVEMCYAGENPCDAARAYRNMCSEKGVLALVPLGC